MSEATDNSDVFQPSVFSEDILSQSAPNPLDSVEADITLEQVTEKTGLPKMLNIGKRAIEGAAVTFEVLPITNGPSRYGLFALTLAATGNNTLAGVAVLAGSTLIVEGGAALAMSDILHRGSSKTIDSVNKVADKVIPENAKMTPVTEAIVANYFGTSILLAEKQREDPNRTRNQNIKHGMLITGCIVGACAIQGAAISEGLADPTNIKVVGPIALMFGGMYAAGRWAKNKIGKTKTEEK